MKFLHVSDLHFGKVIHGVSMLENGDQPHWVDQFLALAEEIRPDAVVIAGDVYDRSSPSGEAVSLMSRMLVGLESLGIAVLLVAGNHDSGARLAFASEILARQSIHIAGSVKREMDRVVLRDGFGEVHFWLMPYAFPAAVAQALGDDEIRDYDTAVRRLIAEQEIDTSARDVIIAHQNVTVNGKEMERGGSESAVGGVGQVGHSAFDGFDYAALGHIHAAYKVGREAVRYAGSPLCYHFDETLRPAKGPILVEMGEKGSDLRMETLHIEPLHAMRIMKGEADALYEQELARGTKGEYLKLIITDKPMTPEISDRFQALAESRGSVLMERVSEFRLISAETETPDGVVVREKLLEELFADFYQQRVGDEPDEKDLELFHHAGELLRNNPFEGGKPEVADERLKNKLLTFLMKQEESVQ